jgi:predicted nucleic acid-binding protein
VKYLLDSVILIDHFNGISAATAFIDRHGTDSALSVITRAEVLAGFDDESESLATRLLDCFPTLPMTVETADAAARLRRTERWKLPDAIQAAIARAHGLILVTRNSRDFQPGGDPEVLIPYRSK